MLPVGPLLGLWRVVKKSGGISRPKASRFRIRVQVLLHRVAKSWISDSCEISDADSGCWALPSLKSPKFMALVDVSENGFWLVLGLVLFEVSGLV